MTELRSEVAQDAVQQGILAWLLKRMKVRKDHKQFLNMLGIVRSFLASVLKSWDNPAILKSEIFVGGFQAKMPFDANKLYSSEITAILLQNSDGNLTLFLPIAFWS